MSVARQVLSRLGCRMPAVTVSRGVASAQGDQVTHTGQQFDKSDPRNARFTVTGLEKQVNEQFAIDLIAKVPPIVVNKRIVSFPTSIIDIIDNDFYHLEYFNFQVSCDGGGGALGHPKVYINLDDGKPVSCIYCGLRYVFDPDQAEH